MNPTLAIAVCIWDVLAYQWTGSATPQESWFKQQHFGRYIWVYVFAPYLGSVLAGLFARLHYNHLLQDAVPDQNARVEEKN